MPHIRATATRLSTALLAAVTLLAAACYQPVSGDQAAGLSAPTSAADVPTATPILALPAPVILSVETATPGPPRPTLQTATPVAPVATPEAPATAQPTAEPTIQPSVTATAEPTPTPVPATSTPDVSDPDQPRTVDAVPLTDADLVAAIVARGLTYTPRDQRLGCTGRAADVRHLDSPNGPPLTLWVYPTSDDLKADWILPSSGAPSPTIANCEIDGGWLYWSENLVIAFEPQAEWIPEGATREAIVQAFFSLTR